MSLNHSAYPHLLDAIFAASDHRALLALRSASRVFRDRADSILFKHVSVHVADDTVYLRVPSGSFSAPTLINLPSLPFPALASKRAQSSLAAQLTHTRTLDLHAPLPVEYCAWIRQYQTVRRSQLSDGTVLPSHTYVEYLDLSSAPRGLAGEWMLDIPAGLRRSVIHLSWQRSSCSAVRRMVQMQPCIPRHVDVVILLEPYGEVGDKALNVLKEAMRVARRVASKCVASKCVVSIVGLERLSPTELGLSEGQDVSLSEICTEAGRELLKRGARLEGVKLLSWEEWRATEETVLH
ncbi:uncharacterized protein CcaverHIS019_0106740 [Cutaneotrichosporon cavernicola]|uniref:Uncharacterized protein n=1 Tax=Cutaneotrichosporon cavernicola TaxID=279322 RepID=A0AA48HYR3_9TREE|nr:uncharacterized protein CcaverHIS019_0106740 [Cutaneotrichosporon cavernicola]BEI87956.1 hypothetical protein CcaverHIS019_0106740 [Cutaneotrichosporon cavernicola]BEI95730.1 hypothetical protein CcaverHIS631_0106790 [Cutaneotrichosporon cavernicola]BEJ03504.1 hypothetical protein CcaverHIS641_0106790 [Cutaneotrichosporon cavernicola]